MSVNDAERDGSSTRIATIGPVSGENAPELRPGGSSPWHSDQHVTIPDPVAGYIERTALAERCAPANRRLTVLKAPGGFGKTTLLAASCRDLLDRGVPVAWLSLDGEDEPGALDLHIAHAFQRAGLDVSDRRPSGGEPPSGTDPVTKLLVALENREEPWVLALDNLQTLRGRTSVASLNELVRNAPPNLHLAVSCREFPVGLDLAGPLFEGAADFLTEEDLRFSRAEIERFFDGKLSRRRTDGRGRGLCGLAHCARHRARGAGRASAGARRAGVDVQLGRVEPLVRSCGRRRGIPARRRPVRDDRCRNSWKRYSAAGDALGRLKGMSGVAGLLEPVRGSGGRVLRLHPLVRGHCANRRRREGARTFSAGSPPPRHSTGPTRRNHGRRGACRRGERCGAGGADPDGWRRRPDLAAGGRRTAARRQSVPDGRDCCPIPAACPHPGCGADFQGLVAAGEADAGCGRKGTARRRFRPGGVRGSGRCGRNPDRGGGSSAPGGARGSEIERCIALGMLALNGCAPVGSSLFKAVIAHCGRIVELPGIEPLVRATLEWGICEAHNQKAEFEQALDRGRRTRRWLGGPVVLSVTGDRWHIRTGRHGAGSFPAGSGLV